MKCVVLLIVICAIAPVYLYPSSKDADHKQFHPYQHHYVKRETKEKVVVAKYPKPGKPRVIGVRPHHLGDTKSNGCLSNFYKDPNDICRQEE